MAFFAGIDLGGTNIKAGIVDENGRVVYKLSRPTKSERGHMPVIKDMAKLIFELSDGKRIPMGEIACIGIGCPGTINKEKGEIEFSNNLGWHGVKVEECMQRLTGKKIFLENDANTAAFGEYTAGSLAGSQNALFITIGTGLGSGIILNGKIYGGFNFMGGELGHMVIMVGGRQCTCGRKGCLEAYASASALAEQTKEMMLKDEASKMWEICPNIHRVNGEVAFKARKMGDKAAAAVIDNYVNYLSCGIVSAVNILQPQVVAIGGGLSGSAEEIIPEINRRIKEEAFSRFGSEHCVVRAASLGNDAGIIGAAMLWKNN